MANTVIKAEGIHKFFGKKLILQDISLEISQGEIFGILGPSGCGKTTLIKLISGIKRRLSLAGALLHEPSVIILDEPTVGIDPLLRQQIWQELYRLAHGGATIVLTTHVMDEAAKCNRLAMMRNGQLIAQGTFDELLHQTGTSSIEEAFIFYGGDPYARSGTDTTHSASVKA